MPRFLHAMCANNNKQKTTKEFSKASWSELRLDSDVTFNPDVLGSLIDMDGIKSDSLDGAFINHSLERLYPHQTITALTNVHRVLKKDGYLVLICSDLQSVAELIAEDKYLEPIYDSPAGPVSPIDIIYGFRGYLAAGQQEFAIHCGFTAKALSGTLAHAGFQSVWCARNPSLFTLGAIATKSEVTDEVITQIAMKHFSE